MDTCTTGGARELQSQTVHTKEQCLISQTNIPLTCYYYRLQHLYMVHQKNFLSVPCFNPANRSASRSGV